MEAGQFRFHGLDIRQALQAIFVGALAAGILGPRDGRTVHVFQGVIQRRQVGHLFDPFRLAAIHRITLTHGPRGGGAVLNVQVDIQVDRALEGTSPRTSASSSWIALRKACKVDSASPLPSDATAS